MTHLPPTTVTSPRTRRLGRPGRAVIALVALTVLSACTSSSRDSDSPDPSETNSSTGATSATTVPDEDVRAALAVLDPCALLTEGTTAGQYPVANGPHSCAAEFDDGRVTIEVGIPFPDALRAEDQLTTAGPLALYDNRGGCRAALPIGPEHAVSLLSESSCGPLTDIATSVAQLLVDRPDSVMHANAQNTHTACGLLRDAAKDPATLVDTTGRAPQGLDQCEIAVGPELDRTTLNLDYADRPLEEVAESVGGRLVKIGDQTAVVDQADQACFLRAYLWNTDAPGLGETATEATVRAGSCGAAREAGRVVLAAARLDPPAAGDLADLLIPATS